MGSAWKAAKPVLTVLGQFVAIPIVANVNFADANQANANQGKPSNVRQYSILGAYSRTQPLLN